MMCEFCLNETVRTQSPARKVLQSKCPLRGRKCYGFSQGGKEEKRGESLEEVEGDVRRQRRLAPDGTPARAEQVRHRSRCARLGPGVWGHGNYQILAEVTRVTLG